MASPSGKTGYRGGRIVRIRLENFMVYKHFDFRPTPGLNLILGVNGSGKSSIMCAICLCLGGKTADTGKTMRMADFINGRNKFANIFIELDDPERKKNVCIRRYIESKGHSKFFINEREVKEEMVHKELRRFNIQVGNLCQFLPQEKVADFARMNQQQLLDSMQQAVGDLEIYSNYKKLIELQKRVTVKESDLSKGKEFIAGEQQKNDSIKLEVDKIERQEACRKRVEMLELQLPFCMYLEKASECTEQADQVDSARESLNRLKDQFANQQNIVASIEQEIKKQTFYVRKCMTELQARTSNYEKSKELSNTYDEKISDVIYNLNSQIKNVEENRKRENALTERLAGTVTDHKTYENIVVQLMKTIDNNKGKKEEIQHKLINAQYAKSACNTKILDMNAEIKIINDELQVLNNMHTKKLNYLKARMPDVFKAMMHLKTIPHNFKKGIFGPLMMLINVKHSQFVKCVENHIPQRDMFIFLCEDSDDAVKFVKIFSEELHLNVNSSIVPPMPLSSFQPSINEATMKGKYSFSCYLKDVIEGPDQVLAFLCNTSYIHLVPVGDSIPQRKLDLIISEAQFKRFYVSDWGYTLKQSRYGSRNTSCATFQLREKGILGHSGARSKQLSLQQRKEENEVNINAEQQLFQSMIDKEKELRRENEEFKQSDRDLHKAENDVQRSRDEIIHIKNRLATLRSNNVDIDEIKIQAANKIKLLDKQKMSILSEILKLLKDCYGLAQQKTKALLIHASATKNKAKYQSIIDNFNEEKAKLKEDLVEEQQKLSMLKNEAIILMRKALAAYEIDPRLSKEERIKQLQTVHIEKFGKAVAPKLENVKAEMNKLRGILGCISVTDSAVFSEYQDRLHEIKERQKSVDSLTDEVVALHAEIEAVKSLWLVPLEELVAKISARFSGYFKNLGCAGEVEIVKSANPNEFEQYGLAIRVKYRDNAPLKDLSQSHHSGGERSVAVIIFILSLQELTEVPFRCVDEINQGMDSVFERKVFEFIEASAENCSQYFLLTPKLLPGLNYSKDIKIHVILSGVSLQYPKWDLKRILTTVRNIDS